MQTIWILSAKPQETLEEYRNLSGFPAARIVQWDELSADPTQFMDTVSILSLPETWGSGDSSTESVKIIADFVDQGGCLLALEGTENLINTAFPGFLQDNPSEQQDIQSQLIPDPAQAVISFSYGKGFVQVNTLPSQLDNPARETDLMAFMITNALVHPARLTLLERLKRDRTQPIKQTPIFLENPASSYTSTFEAPLDRTAQVLLNWEGDTRIHLRIEDERGKMSLDHESSQPPMVWTASLPGGKWLCKVSLAGEDTPAAPVFLVQAAVFPFIRRMLPQNSPGPVVRTRRCPACKMPLNPTSLFCPACGREVDK